MFSGNVNTLFLKGICVPLKKKLDLTIQLIEYKNIALSIFFLSIPLICFSQKTKEVYSEYTYYTTESTSIEEAKKIAFDRAKIQAIAETFGTQISQNATTLISTDGNKSDSHFFMLGASDIKGEWLETLRQPTYTIKVDSPFIIVNCKVKGKIREFIQPEIEIEASILKNGITLDFESTNFKDGDDLYLHFKSSAAGNIIIYLMQNDIAYRLLPYKKSLKSEYIVEAEKIYVFFSKITGKDTDINIDEYELFSDKEIDSANVLIIYTPNSIGGTQMAELTYDEPLSTDIETFNKWLIKKRNKDKYSRVIILPLTIRKS